MSLELSGKGPECELEVPVRQQQAHGQPGMTSSMGFTVRAHALSTQWVLMDVF